MKSKRQKRKRSNYRRKTVLPTELQTEIPESIAKKFTNGKIVPSVNLLVFCSDKGPFCKFVGYLDVTLFSVKYLF